MAVLNINSGLDSFVLLDQVIDVDEREIIATKNFSESSNYLVLEAMAQLASLHVRYLNAFKVHSFLSKINYSCIKSLSGEVQLRATLKAKSSKAYLYLVEALLDIPLVNAELLIATAEYSDLFPQKTIQKHYRMVWQCLTAE